MAEPPILLFAVLVIGVVVLIQFWCTSRARQMVETWARNNGFRILSCRYHWIRRGPFFWNSSKSQMVYRVTVRTPEGKSRSGWVRCGSYWGGVFVERVEVRWEDELI
jgi:hypothetical protein